MRKVAVALLVGTGVVILWSSQVSIARIGGGDVSPVPESVVPAPESAPASAVRRSEVVKRGSEEIVVIGRVVDESDHPLPGIRVRSIWSSDGAEPATLDRGSASDRGTTATSHDDGRFSLAVPPRRGASLTIECGFDSIHESRIFSVESRLPGQRDLGSIRLVKGTRIMVETKDPYGGSGSHPEQGFEFPSAGWALAAEAPQHVVNM